MLRRSSRIHNRKMLKTEGDDDDDQTRVATDCGGESSSESSAVLNPLQNVVILCHLFERCPPDVLATCRLVCKQWYEESLITWRNSTPLTFTLENGHIYMEYGKRFWYGGTWHYTQLPLDIFLECVADPKSQSQRKPYRYIRLRNSIIDSDIANKKLFDIFWNALGSNLTTLELMGCEFTDDEEFRGIIFTHCPKLKRLIIDKCKFSTTRKNSIEELVPLDHNEQPFKPNNHLKHLEINYSYYSDKQLPFSWLEEMFFHFPLMSSLTIEPHYQMPIDKLDSLAKVIRKVRKKDGKLVALKVFDVGLFTFGAPADPSDKQRLAIFKELRLPLQRLHVHDGPGIDEVMVRDIAAFCAKTVKELQLGSMGPLISESSFRHKLDNLKTLLIQNCSRKYFALLDLVPNLEKLVILEIDYDNGEKYRKITIPNTDTYERAHLKMKKLTYLELLVKLSDDDIAKITDWMPNVTDLTLADTNDKQFGIVCKQWRNLRKLSVFGDYLTDDGVAGMKNKGANITNLQNLEEFEFESSKLSARSVFHGFLQLPILRVLAQLSAVKPVRWGEWTRRALIDRNIRLEGYLDYTYYSHRRRY